MESGSSSDTRTMCENALVNLRRERFCIATCSQTGSHMLILLSSAFYPSDATSPCVSTGNSPPRLRPWDLGEAEPPLRVNPGGSGLLIDPITQYNGVWLVYYGRLSPGTDTLEASLWGRAAFSVHCYCSHHLIVMRGKPENDQAELRGRN